jgi:hypothetical protein
MHRGRFFTEQQVDPSAITVQAAQANVQADTGTTGIISNPTKAPDGTLLLDYAGPRTLLVIVFAADVRVGRGFLSELYQRASLSSVPVLKTLGEYTSGTSLLPPIELYPGSVPVPRWQTCEQVKDANGLAWTDLPGSVINPACPVQNNRITVTCAARPNRGRFVVGSTPQTTTITVGQLVPHQVTITSQPHIVAAQWRAEFARDLEIQVSCNASAPIACGSTPALTWEVTPLHRAARQALGNGQSSSGPTRVRQLSTENPAAQPHRVFGLQSLLENFYDKFPDSSGGRTVFTLDVCNQ